MGNKEKFKHRLLNLKNDKFSSFLEEVFLKILPSRSLNSYMRISCFVQNFMNLVAMFVSQCINKRIYLRVILFTYVK